MPVSKKESVAGGSTSKLDSRTQNGNRPGFRTDAAISNNRFGNERTLQPWVPDSADGVDGSLEASTGGGGWDQFAENERLFGLKTDYDENIYTTAINKNHPQYKERCAAAERKAREIERSAPATAHVAEERIMDFTGGSGPSCENEEDKYSGVRRQEAPLVNAGRENRYTPPARRAPAGQSTVKGAPVDPAIISSQIKGSSKRQQAALDQSRSQANDSNKNGVPAKTESQRSGQTKRVEEKPGEVKPGASTRESKTPDAKAVDKAADKTTVSSSAAAPSRQLAVQAKEGAPSAASTVERDVLNSFKTFASQQRLNAEKVRSNKARADKEVKLTELKKFANSFKLSTPVPSDLVSIIAKDPIKQKEIQAKAIKNAEEVAKTKAELASKEKTQSGKEGQAKSAEQSTTVHATEGRQNRVLGASQASGGAGSGNNRHAGPRQQFSAQVYHGQPFRNSRGGGQHTAAQQQQQQQSQQQGGNLAQRLRHMEQHRYSQPVPPVQHGAGPDVRVPPTGPANHVDAGFTRRLSGAPGNLGTNKLNPNSHEFKPSAFSSSFGQNPHASSSSSPRAPGSHMAAESPASASLHAVQLIRRKTKAVDVAKCFILSHIKTISPPQGRNWEDNGGLRPSFDTLPTWRQLQDDEKADSTMHLTYKEYFDRQPFASQSMTTPNQPHALPQMAHQHQLPFHLQHGAHGLVPRQSPHMPPMQMHAPQHGPVPHAPFASEDHRMMHSNSASSFASPRMGQLPVAYPTPVPYNQPMFMGPNTPQMGQYRSFSNNPHYTPPQQGQMSGPMMMHPQFIPGPQGMMAAPQMVYHGGHPQFIPPTGPPQPLAAVNGGYPSPGRPAAPVMVHQGSQQGQAMYGMSPNVQFNQPAYVPGQPNGPMSSAEGYDSPELQHALFILPHHGLLQWKAGNGYGKHAHHYRQVRHVT
ncbi:hypothetical protein CDD82_2290 [Ophiocordyceps australis]|uniref:LsmAD domain-containing protein n=1 Tax=Ophiocordyceps australis TaxID=1399860 RepID=A0A2C5ZIB9_9HYPO|nr:hypothetical protein CDD82_2290 [Ophiocordyceps australis]